MPVSTQTYIVFKQWAFYINTIISIIFKNIKIDYILNYFIIYINECSKHAWKILIIKFNNNLIRWCDLTVVIKKTV